MTPVLQRDAYLRLHPLHALICIFPENRLREPVVEDAISTRVHLCRKGFDQSPLTGFELHNSS
jgi:hypothetical protein